jgi:hypothetical protein
MSLPQLGPLTRADLIRFDLVHALPVAWTVLRKRFGGRAALGLIGRYLWGSLRDPLRSAGAGELSAQKETLTRHQLRAALRLDDALLGGGVAEADRLAALREVIGTAGARFIATNAPLDPVAWRASEPGERQRYASDMLGRFPNAHFTAVEARPEGLDFDVTYCRLAELCREMGRPHLALLFCFADAVYFEGTAGLSLTREETIAGGAEKCSFRIGT